MSTPSNREQSQPALFRASTPTPSVASAGGAAKKGGSKKGKKSRAASTAPSAAGDGQINGVQWASPIQASVSDPTGIGGPGESNAPVMPVSAGALPGSAGKAGVDDDGEGDEDKEDLLPDMADDDYSAQLSWQSQTKDNLKVLMDNFDADQYDRYEAYRRNALPKQAVRRVIQSSLGQQVSAPVAQIVAGFGKVFVGEIVEKARAVQKARGETGPLSPDHLREAYRQYQEKKTRSLNTCRNIWILCQAKYQFLLEQNENLIEELRVVRNEEQHAREQKDVALDEVITTHLGPQADFLLPHSPLHPVPDAPIAAANGAS